MGSKKHKKHKSDKRDRYDDKQFGIEKPPALKLILKVGSSSTPEHSSDSPGPSIPLVHTNINYNVAPTTGDEESRHSTASLHGREETHLERQHKKAKKKKKKKEKDKDREKHEKKHKHHHKEKRKRLRDESSQDDGSLGEESLSDPPLPKRPAPDSLRDGLEQPSREPRSCVLRQRQERSPLQKLLDHLLKSLEKRDPQQFFAWPVTDNIAPGYSQIIHQPMDFSTMKQKIDDNQYAILADYIDDFRLMCNNAMVYNHPETIYYKAARKLLHVGLKLMSPDKLRGLRSVVTFMGELTREELGFEIGAEEVRSDAGEEQAEDGPDEGDAVKEHRRQPQDHPRPLGKFEAIPDDLSPEEVLQQAQSAARTAATRLSLQRANTKMGFLRQRPDGTTSLAILVPNEGTLPGSNERPVALGVLSGKLAHGTGQLQGFREDRRNLARTVKPLYYGAFGSYAPSYDSTFANLTKEESDLVYQTYGDETAVQYAESILDFSKDCEYTLTMVDNLLDLLTGGEHRRTKRFLEERRRLTEEEERVRQMLEGRTSSPTTPHLRVDFDSLKSLDSCGIDVSFLDAMERELSSAEETRAVQEAAQARLDHTSSLLQRLQQVQSDRLSLPPPPHLALVAQPSEAEHQLADRITDNLKDMTKKVPPNVVAPTAAVRKALGVNPASSPLADGAEEVDVEGTPQAEPDVPDLESELREFLESEPALTHSPLHDDKTIEEILSES